MESKAAGMLTWPAHPGDSPEVVLGFAVNMAVILPISDPLTFDISLAAVAWRVTSHMIDPDELEKVTLSDIKNAVVLTSTLSLAPADPAASDIMAITTSAIASLMYLGMGVLRS